MKRHRIVVLMILLAVALASLPSDAKDKSGDAGRLLTGKVVDTSGQPVAGALVALIWAGETGGSMMSVQDGHRATTNAQSANTAPVINLGSSSTTGGR